MAAAGLRPYLVDWGTPNADERRFDTTAYVARLERALAFVTKRARRAPAVMGYCMGGTLTVALAARQPRRVAGLALLAAPWDFHADRTGHAFLLSAGPMLARVADQVGELPVDILQTLFWSLDPWLAMKKFGRFLGMDQQGASAREFVLLEDWLNEGAPLAGPTARECLVGWYGDNLPGTGKWIVGGRRIVPSKISVPSLVMIPSGDRIVPPLSAAALAEPGRGLKRVTRLDLPLGHIGMVVSGRARDLCWTPLIDWLRRYSFQALVMAAEERSIDWRQLAVWAVLLIDLGVRPRAMSRSPTKRGAASTGVFGRVLAIEVSSHIVVAALLPALYWMHRRWPVSGGPRNIAIHVAGARALQPDPYVGMAALGCCGSPASWARPTASPSPSTGWPTSSPRTSSPTAC